MNKRLFERLVESTKQHGEIARGERAPSRQFQFDAISVKEIRALTQLSQPKFARTLDVDVGTLLSWEQGRREPAAVGELVGRPRSISEKVGSKDPPWHRLFPRFF